MSLVSILKRKNNKILFTTPSHSGKYIISHKFYHWYRKDISEVDAYNPQEALIKAEKHASELYGTKYTKFLINGSTSGIIASILASKAKNILIWSNSHPCHKNGAILAGANIIYYDLPTNKELGVYKAISTDCVKELLQKNKADCILITSPTYEGFAADINNISKICRQYNVKLIVDEAHGALYPFSDELPESAIKYADYTVQSLHKTAGGINPTALLHSNDNDPADALSMINTTSPSYPMLSTIEANINFLFSSKGKKEIQKLINNIKKLYITKYNDDITKIILKSEKHSGYELSDILYNKFNIEDEKTNEKSTMLLCGIGTDRNKFLKLKQALNYFGL